MKAKENNRDTGMEETDEMDQRQAEEQPGAERATEARQRPAILRRGVLQLKTPIKSRDDDITEIEYDFDRITGKELLDILDSKTARERAASRDDFTARQGLRIFAKAARSSGGLDEYDLLERLGMEDTLAAMQLGKVFFMVTASEAAGRIKSL